MGWRSGCSYGLDGPGFEFLQRQDIFLVSKTSRPTLGPTQPPIQGYRCSSPALGPTQPPIQGVPWFFLGSGAHLASYTGLPWFFPGSGPHPASYTGVPWFFPGSGAHPTSYTGCIVVLPRLWDPPSLLYRVTVVHPRLWGPPSLLYRVYPGCPGGSPVCVTLYADLPVHAERPWAVFRSESFCVPVNSVHKLTCSLCCKEDYGGLVLLMVGEEICVLSLIMQTRKVTSDMCDFPPQFARHTSTIARRASAVFGAEQFRHWRIQISHSPSLPLHSRPLWCMNF